MVDKLVRSFGSEGSIKEQKVGYEQFPQCKYVRLIKIHGTIENGPHIVQGW